MPSTAGHPVAASHGALASASCMVRLIEHLRVGAQLDDLQVSAYDGGCELGQAICCTAYCGGRKFCAGQCWHHGKHMLQIKHPVSFQLNPPVKQQSSIS